MASEEDYIRLLEESGLTKAEIKDLVEKKIKDMDGLIDEKTALFILVKDRKLDGAENQIKATSEIDFKIKDLIDSKSEMQNISAVGRISEPSQMHSFNRKSGTKGYVSNFYLYDDSGRIRVVLWDARAKYVLQDSFVEGEIVRVLNASLRKSKDGFNELHVGIKGSLELNPLDVDYTKYPKKTIIDEPKDFDSITLSDRNISIQGIIVDKGDVRTFQKKNSNEQLRNMRLYLKQKDTILPVVIWNDDIDKLNEMDIDDEILITKVYAKGQYQDNTKIELNLSRNSSIKLVKKANSDVSKKDQILQIKEAMVKQGYCSIEGEIIEVGDLKVFQKKNGTEGKLLYIIMGDDSDSIRVTFWDNDAEYFQDLQTGEVIRIEKLWIALSNYSGNYEGTYRKLSKLTRGIDKHFENLKLPIPQGGSYKDKDTKPEDIPLVGINEIETSSLYKIKGTISEVYDRIPIYEACGVCNRKEENCVCENGPQDISYRMIVTVKVEDGTGTINAKFFGNEAEKLLGMDATSVNLEINSDSSMEFINKIKENLINKTITIAGRTKFNDYSEGYEIIVNSFELSNSVFSDDEDDIFDEFGA